MWNILRLKKLSVIISVIAMLTTVECAIGDDGSNDFDVSISGYLRTHFSFNLHDIEETSTDDTFDMSMARSTLQAAVDVKKGDIAFHAIGRLVGEIRTNYLERLEELGAANGDLMDEYNDSELREYYVDFSPHERVDVKIGKQQVVWGESDFFQAMDIVHGFDFRWRLFFELENEDWRKPLIMANVKIQIPEANGALQLLFRPGVDDEDDIGNTYAYDGGRWLGQPNRGVNFLNLIPYNFEHPDGDYKDPTWGIRWTGMVGALDYSLAYLRTLGPDPVVNPIFNQYKTTTTLGSLGELFYPETDIFGATMNAYVPFLDAVVATEVVYTPDQFYNLGSNFLGGALPGFAGITKQDTLRSMFRLDWESIRCTQKLFKTYRPSWLSVQIFNTWLMDYNDSDDIVENAGYGAKRKEYTTMITAILAMYYNNDRVCPTFVIGSDVSNGDWFGVPRLDIKFGDNWRLRTEFNLFFPASSKEPGEFENDTHTIGLHKNNDQLSIRLTYQF